jgi:AcrR family transcriptional regulator
MVKKLLTVGQQMAYTARVSEPAYTRLENDERRRRLLELGADLFTRYAYDEISMAQIAREAGISKALLYHYFPSKQDYFVATFATGRGGAARRVRARSRSAAGRGAERIAGRLPRWIEENSDAYAKLLQSAATVPEIRDLVEGVRAATVERVLAGSARPSRRLEPRCAAGCGSWTARSSIGSTTATSTAASSWDSC